MKKCMVAALIGMAVGLGLARNAQAEERAWNWSPLGVGLAAPIQLPFTESDVYGLRLGGFFGNNNDVYGLDFGVAELCAGDFIGLQGSLFSWTEGRVRGVQLAALANVVNGNAAGVQLACVNTVWGEAKGLQLGVVNYDAAFAGVQFGLLDWNNSSSYGAQFGVANANQDEFVGWSVAPVNYSLRYKGCQLGCVNSADEVTGCQIGVFNACNKLRGVQIGLLNLIASSSLPVMVIANASF